MATKTKSQTVRKSARTVQTSAQEAATGPTCAIEGCGRPIYVRGLCEVHWADPKAGSR
jgi:hypothetical protein